MPDARRSLLACALPWALLMNACSVRTPPATATDIGTPSPTGITFQHPFPPVELVVHPLTRITNDPNTGNARIEAHFELLDQYGHTVKSLGNAALELRVVEVGTAGSAGGPRQLSRWSIDLSSPDANARPFDRVTRTYRLTLIDLPASLPPAETLILAVRFTTNEGLRLSGERRLQRQR